MDEPQISFQVRINTSDTLADLGRRVGAILGCDFTPSEDDFYEDVEALEAFCLGLWISLSGDPEKPEGEMRNYILMGIVQDDYDYEWGDEIDVLTISPYVMRLMRIGDSDEWYIPDFAELAAEAGIDPSEFEDEEFDE